MRDLHLGHRVGALVLVEEAQVRHEGAGEGEQYAEIESHRWEVADGWHPSAALAGCFTPPSGLGGSTVRGRVPARPVCKLKTVGSRKTRPDCGNGRPRSWSAAGPARRPTRRAAKPLLMVDIDGVISLFGRRAARRERTRTEARCHSIEGIPHFLSATAAAHLLALAPLFELVWASGWEERANEHLPHLLGLPAGLPSCASSARSGAANAHWKLDAIERYAGDAPAGVDRRRASTPPATSGPAARAAPTLLVQTEPEAGSRREARAAGALGAGAARRAEQRRRRSRATSSGGETAAGPPPGRAAYSARSHTSPALRRPAKRRRRRPASRRVGDALRRASARARLRPCRATRPRLELHRRAGDRRAVEDERASAAPASCQQGRRRGGLPAGTGACRAPAVRARASRAAAARAHGARRSARIAAARRRARRRGSRSSRRRGGRRSRGSETRAFGREAAVDGARGVDAHRHPARAGTRAARASTPAAARAPLARPAEIGALMNEPSTATPRRVRGCSRRRARRRPARRCRRRAPRRCARSRSITKL